MTASPITEVTETDFQRRVLEADAPVLVEFYASWCGNCRRQEPVLDRLAAELSAQARIVKVDAEASPGLTAEYAITSTPTLVVFEHGAPVSSRAGAQSEQAIRDMLTERSVRRSKSAPGLAWAPADACGLPAEARPLRSAAFEDLFATAVHTVDRTEPNRLLLRLSPEPSVAAEVAELAAREADCCGFFTFTLIAAEGSLSLEVTVPQSRTGVLDGLAAQAETAGASP